MTYYRTLVNIPNVALTADGGLAGPTSDRALIPHIAIATTLSACEFTAFAGFTENRLSGYGVKDSDLPGVAEDALEDSMNKTNPVPVDDAEVVMAPRRRVL